VGALGTPNLRRRDVALVATACSPRTVVGRSTAASTCMGVGGLSARSSRRLCGSSRLASTAAHSSTSRCQKSWISRVSGTGASRSLAVVVTRGGPLSRKHRAINLAAHRSGKVPRDLEWHDAELPTRPWKRQPVELCRERTEAALFRSPGWPLARRASSPTASPVLLSPSGRFPSE
jgi:hypothetical protein